MSEAPTFGRYTEIPYDEMTPEQQEGYHSLLETRGPLGGPRKIWVHNPKLAKAIGPLGGHFHPGHYSLTEREREIAVIIITSKWRSAYRPLRMNAAVRRWDYRPRRSRRCCRACRPRSRTSASRRV
jgi:hypothetical protein